METKIVQWVQCDDQIKEYNDKMKEKIKPVKQIRDKLSDEILQALNINIKCEGIKIRIMLSSELSND